MIAYGTPVDMSDEYLGMDKDTIIMCTKAFADTVVRVYGDQYLRTPNAKDMVMLLAMNEARGWPGMLGSVDCMHWRWKNCLQLGKANSPGIANAMIRQLFWKRLPSRIYGFGIATLGCLDLTMT